MPTALFDREKLDVYQLELSVIAWLTELFEELRDIKGARLAETLDQLDRASLSALLNTAEGNGKRVSQLRARFFDDARGSATECAACLDALVAKRACSAKRVDEGKAMLLRIVSMLTKLVDRFDDVSGVSRAAESRTSSSRRTRTRTRTKLGGYQHG
ncbi:MAG: four helix bundle protein [Verrucomicrobiaceae bacterium]|nr:four helix bundle protein [Verrucomicrobiaceae bacterium]